MIKNSSTAILIFTRTASEEASAKTFDSNLGKKGNAFIAEKLIKQSIAISKKTRLPVYTFFSSEQQGNSFGVRLANAFESVFKKGFQNVIAIGNDCPDLSTSLLQDASHRLEKDDLVLGPTLDGGVFLIGLCQSAYHRKHFIDLAWENSGLQNSWAAYSKTQDTTIVWLKKLRDIDTRADFNAILKKLLVFSKLRHYFLSILATLQVYYLTQYFVFRSAFYVKTQSLRAPPLPFH